MQIGFTDGEERTAVAQLLYYARRAGYLEGAMGLIAAGTTGVDPQLAAQRALAAVGPDVLAEENGTKVSDETCTPFTLTDAERAAVGFCATLSLPETAQRGGVAGELCRMHAATLRGLLERTQPGRPEAIATGDNAASAETGIPPEPATPPEWLSRPYYVDPPSGWMYGFPKLYDPQADGDMTEWMIAEGYPEHLARQGLPCTFTEYRR